jgi:hypothetical protein
MTYVRTRPSGGEQRLPHWGFDQHGRCFRSETPVDNAVTNYVRRTVYAVRAQAMPPADVVLALVTEPDWIRALFPPVVTDQWASLTRFSEWPVAFTTSSVHEAIKRQGRGA